MAEVAVHFGPEHAQGRSLLANGSSMINCFTEPTNGGPVPYAIYSGMGFSPFATFDGGGIHRGFHLMNASTAYAVSGENIYKLRSNGSAQLIGAVLGQSPVIMAQNKKNTGPQLAIVADTKVYILENDTVTEFVDPDLPSGAKAVAYFDGYLIFVFSDGRLYITGINDTSIAPLDFAEAEASPDDLVTVFVHKREVLFMGTDTIEPWVDTGNATFPFERVNSALIPVGCLSKYTPKNFDNTVVFISNKGHVVRLEGYDARRISDFDVEAAIQRTVNLGAGGAITAETWSEGGHEFYSISSMDWTYTYDASTQLWFKEQSLGLKRTRRAGYIRAFDKHIVGDVSGGKTYQMSFDYRDEAGIDFVWSVRSKPIEAGEKRIRFDRLNIFIETGVGIAPGDNFQQENPKIMVRWSDDRGKTWDGDIYHDLGQQGRYDKQITMTRMGMSQGYGRIFEISSSSPVVGALVSAKATIQVMS
jgi:hypothetical protein